MKARNRIKVLVALAMMAFASASCSRPSGGEVFLTSPRNAYSYSFDVPDTLIHYDLSFYTRVDRFGKEVMQPMEALRFDVVWRDPVDSAYRETVYMEPDFVDGTVRKYRSMMHFPSAGTWTMAVTVSPEIKGFRGLGLVWDSYYGTR